MISIVIPAYEMNGKGTFFIRKSLEYISKQIFKDYEVVISDHSINNEIQKICEDFPDIDINYIKNENDRGSSSANLNNAIKNSKYNLIKFLMQDEYLYDENLLSEIVNCFNDNNVNWVATGCINGPSPEEPKYIVEPYYNPQITEGRNTIGSPSCVSIRKTDDIEYFDNNLIWMMDCDYYKRLFDKWGHPKTLPHIKVFINHHKDQLTNIISRERQISEEQLLKNKYI